MVSSLSSLLKVWLQPGLPEMRVLTIPKQLKNKQIIGYYDNILIITGFIRTDKVFHLRSYWKKGNNSETTLDNPAKRKCKIALVKTHMGAKNMQRNKLH